MHLSKLRIKAGITILILLTLLSNVNNSVSMMKTFPAFLKVDSVTINESRFAELKKYLPKYGEVGYITDVDNKKIFSSSSDNTLEDEKAADKAIDIMAQLILTQYSLAPAFVYNQPDMPYVVGNFPNGLPDKSYFIKKHMFPVRIFPQYRLILLRNEAVK